MKNTVNRKLILYALALINFTNIVDSMLIMPLGDIFISEFGIDASQYSLLVSAYSFSAFFSSLIGVFYLDRFDRKQVLLTVYIGFGLGTLACAYADSYMYLLTLRIVTGFFGGIISALVLSVITDLYEFKERGAAIGVLFAAFSAASALGLPIGLYLAAMGDWQLPFMIIGLVALCISGGVYLWFPNLVDHMDQQQEKISIRKTITAITSDPNQINALIAGFVLIFAHFLIIPFISPYLIKNVGLSQMDITYQFFFGGLATIFTSPIIGKLTDRVGVMKVFLVVMILSWVPTLLITHMTVVPLAVALTYTTMFFVFASGRMISPNTIITEAARKANRGSFMSVKSALQQLAIGIAAIVSGLIVTQDSAGLYDHYEYEGYLSITISILAIWLVNRIKVGSE